MYRRYENYQRKRWEKKSIRQGNLSNPDYQNRKKNRGMGRAIMYNLRTILGAFNGIPAILIVIFLWRRWADIEYFFNGLFTRPSKYFKGSVKDLPKDKNYYRGLVNNLKESLDGITIVGFDLLQTFVTVNNEELQYITDLYSSLYSPEVLTKDIKKAYILKSLNPLTSSAYGIIKTRFLKADIPFKD